MNNKVFPAGTIFITGISASGKSTLGSRLKQDLLGAGINNVRLLDGEEIRQQLARQGKHYGYSTDERNRLALEIAHMACEYNKEGMICILCAICHVKEMRQKIRELIGSVIEIYLDCAVNVCAQRDQKGNYAKALSGVYDNFIGVTEPYQKSDNVDLILCTDADSIENCSQKLFKTTLSFLKEKLLQNNIIIREEQIVKVKKRLDRISKRDY